MATVEKLTTETLQIKTDSYGSVIVYGNFVLASFATWSKDEGFGNNALVYRLAEAPIPGFGSQSRGRGECALELVTEADHLFADAGHAIAWALPASKTQVQLAGIPNESRVFAPDASRGRCLQEGVDAR